SPPASRIRHDLPGSIPAPNFQPVRTCPSPTTCLASHTDAMVCCALDSARRRASGALQFPSSSSLLSITANRADGTPTSRLLATGPPSCAMSPSFVPSPHTQANHQTMPASTRPAPVHQLANDLRRSVTEEFTRRKPIATMEAHQ
ncbi:hypothetical protein GQ607_011337, partial [Colletotrichum asianum]